MTTVIHLNHDHDRTNYVYIGRPSKWGNPFVMGRDGNRHEVLTKFREYVKSRPDLVKAARTELKDKRLGCYCKPKRCHGDLWAKIANGGKL